MKVAVLMHGLVGNTDKYGTGKIIDPSISHGYFKERILDVNDHVDVFAHSWSLEYENQIDNLYSPKKSIFEKQIVFDFEYIVGDPNGPGGEINKWADGKFRGLDNLRFHSMFSKFYSGKMANELKRQYEIENGFRYDMVMLTRYDLAYLVDFDFSKFKKDKFYAIPPISHHGINDLWFISNSENMDNFCQIYDWITHIEHFPHKFTHNHWLSRYYLEQTGMIKNLEFFGEHRPWGMGSVGEKMGPSPLVRHHLDLAEATPDSDMARVRNEIKQNSDKKIKK